MSELYLVCGMMPVWQLCAMKLSEAIGHTNMMEYGDWLFIVLKGWCDGVETTKRMWNVGYGLCQYVWVCLCYLSCQCMMQLHQLLMMVKRHFTPCPRDPLPKKASLHKPACLWCSVDWVNRKQLCCCVFVSCRNIVSNGTHTEKGDSWGRYGAEMGWGSHRHTHRQRGDHRSFYILKVRKLG
jgi:hypothetical protein